MICKFICYKFIIIIDNFYLKDFIFYREIFGLFIKYYNFKVYLYSILNFFFIELVCVFLKLCVNFYNFFFY